MNLYIGKIMKIDKKSWGILKIQGNQLDRDICVSLLNNFMLGSEDKNNSTMIYFDNKNFSEIESFLNHQKIITDWSWSKIKEKNWNANCKDFFKPILINNQVEVIPEWEKSNTDYLTIKINPALAFGTGHHETTYMMIQAILDLDINNKSILDVGTGSGILSILLYKMGNKKIFAIDNDHLVESNFYENLQLNNIESINFEIADCLKLDKVEYDVILANINREIIIELLSSFKKTKSLIILSGILIDDFKLIETALLNNNKSITKKYTRNEWMCIIAE